MYPPSPTYTLVHLYTILSQPQPPLSSSLYLVLYFTPSRYAQEVFPKIGLFVQPPLPTSSSSSSSSSPSLSPSLSISHMKSEGSGDGGMSNNSNNSSSNSSSSSSNGKSGNKGGGIKRGGRGGLSALYVRYPLTAQILADYDDNRGSLRVLAGERMIAPSYFLTHPLNL